MDCQNWAASAIWLSDKTGKNKQKFFYACEKDLTREKKEEDVTKEKSCNTVSLKASAQEYYSS